MRKEWGRKVPVPFRPPAAPVVLEAICGCPLLHPSGSSRGRGPELGKVPVPFRRALLGEMRMSFIDDSWSDW